MEETEKFNQLTQAKLQKALEHLSKQHKTELAALQARHRREIHEFELEEKEELDKLCHKLTLSLYLSCARALPGSLTYT